MPPSQARAESAPIPPERLQAVAEWLSEKLRPAAQVIEGESESLPQPVEFDERDYQLEAFCKLDDLRTHGGKRALGNLATGLGKTFVTAVDVMRYREWCAAQSLPMLPRVLYVSHQKDINDQAEKTFRVVMPDTDYATFNPQRKHRPEADVTFATIQSLYQNLDRFDPQDFEYIIWDESHHLEAETFKAVRDHFDPLFEHAVTATKGRMDGKDIQEYFGEPLYEKSLAEGIAEGHLADVDYHIVFDASIKEKLKGGFNPKTLQEIKELFKDKPPREAIARNIEEEIERLGLVDPKTIIFCENIAEAEEMARLLDGAAYHSETENRKKVLEDFRTGRKRRIMTRDMFNEGVDIPDAELLVFLRSTNSGNIFEQQLGRGLRKAPGKSKVYVLDFVANIERIAKMRELSENIRKRAKELGQQGITVEGDIFEREANDEREIGFRIHTDHSNFDFDKIAVDLLERWGGIKNAVGRGEFSQLSNDELVALAKVLKPDGPLTQAEMNDLSKGKQFISAQTIRHRFGSLVDFQEACGFKEKATLKMTNEELVARAKMLKPDGPLERAEINELSKAKKFINESSVIRKFGSVRAFQEACGLEVEFIPAKMTNDELIALARKLKPDGPLDYLDMRSLAKDKRFVSMSTIIRRFGSLLAFEEACGFEHKKALSDMTNDELIALARKLKPDGPLTQAEMRAFSKNGQFVSEPTIAKRFGSLKAFPEACGFEVRTVRKMTNDEIVVLAQTLKPDGLLDTPEIDSLSKNKQFPSYGTIVNRFGSLKAFQETCEQARQAETQK